MKAGQADLTRLLPAAAAASLGEQFGVNKKQFCVKPTR